MARFRLPGRWRLPLAAAVGILAVAALVIALGRDSGPPTPAELTGQALGGGRARLDWADVSGANGYQVRMWTGDAWTVLPDEGAGLDPDGSSGEVRGLATGEYLFSVRAIGAESLSDWSDAVAVQIARVESLGEDGRTAAGSDAGPGALIGAGPAEGQVAPASVAVERPGDDRFEPATMAGDGIGIAPDPQKQVPGSTCATAMRLGEITNSEGEIGLVLEGPGGPGRSSTVGFELGSTGRVEFSPVGPAAAVDLYLYNEWGRRLGFGFESGPAEGDLAATLLNGAYCLHVVAVDADGREFRLGYSASSVDVELPTELSARNGAVDLGRVMEGGVSNELFGSLPARRGAADYFRLQLTEPGRLVLAASQLDADATIRLEDRTGGVVATGSRAGDERVGISVTLSEGTYFVRVQSGAGVPNNYRLSYDLYAPSAAAVDELRTEIENRLQSSFGRIESLLLPDLIRDPPTDAGAAGVVTTPEGQVLRALRFGGYVTNIGAGPLDLGGNPQLADSGDPTSHDVWQYVLSGSGDWIRLAKPPVRYETSDGHNHFHLLEIVAYSLWDSTGTILVRPGAKTGFCLLDFEEIGEQHPRPGIQRYSEADVEDCMAYRPGATTLRMGISEGWRDFYDRDVPFQWIDVSDVAPGLYRIGAEADPYDIVAESDESNNGVGLSEQLSVVPGFVAAPQVAKTNPGSPVAIELGSTRFGEPGPLGHRIVEFPQNGTLRTGYDFVVYDAGGTARQGFFSPMVTYTPNEGFSGVDTFTFAAFDAWLPQYPVNPVVASVTVDVSGLQPTVTIRGAPGSIDAGASIGFSAVVSGAGPEIVWVVNAPSGAAKLYGEISEDGLYTAPIQPPPGGIITIRAASRQAPAAFAEVVLNIRPAGNTAPLLFAPAAVSSGIGAPTDVWVAASDAQRDVLVWEAENLPPGLEIVGGTGRIVGNPSRAGTWRSTVAVSDGQLTSSVHIEWEIS